MGSAYTALADNAYASVWNPAGLAFVDSVQIAGQHLSYLESINDEYVGSAIPLGHGGRALGVSAQYLGTGDITQADINGFHTGTFSAHYGVYSLAYGQKLGDKLGIGATGKWINAKLSDTSADAFAGDLGLLYKPQDHWRIAATLTNLGNKLTFIDQPDSLPSAFHVAAAYQPARQLLVTGEALHSWPSDRFDGRFGLEWRPMELLALRTGYRTDTMTELSALAGFSVGMGLQLWGQEFAYAWVPYGDLGTTQYFSLLMRFGPEAATRRNLIQYQDIRKSKTAGAGGTAALDPDAVQLMELFDETPAHVASSPGVPAHPADNTQ